ncbi:MAG: DUF58 domain-containing protein [Planctomycetota bacterium]|nr:DUF58 domain-containing protein [Planctomycetota bacterium]
MAEEVSLESLLDAEFLESVSRLRLVARQVPRGGRFADQRSRDLGAGLEFRDHRPYSPGDDLRSMDWNLYRRLGKVFLRLFEELEDLPVYLCPDVSASAFLEEPPRALAGLRSSLALASIALGQHDSVGLFPFAEDLHIAVRPMSGTGRLMTFARALADVRAGGSTDFRTMVRKLGALRLRSGLVVIVSDFFDPTGLAAVTSALKKLRHRLLCVQLVRKTDRDPKVEGDLRLVDCETGGSEDVSVTTGILERYRAAYDEWNEGLAAFAQSRRAGLVRIDVDEDVVPQLASLFAGGRYEA